MSGRNTALTLTISGDVSKLGTALKAGQSLFAEFGRDAVLELDQVKAKMAAMAAAPADAITQMTSNLTKNVNQMAREAKAALAMGADFDPTGGMNAGRIAEQIGALEQLRARRLELAAASLRAAEAEGVIAAEARQAANSFTVGAAALDSNIEALKRQHAVFAAVEAQLPKVAAGQRAVTVSQGQMQAGAQQLSYQIGDVAQQFALGTPPMTIFAQQAGQTVQAFNLMSNGGSKFAAFMASEWGAVLVGGITILSMLIAKSDLFTDAIGDNVDKLEKQAKATRDTEAAQRIYDSSIDGIIGKEHKLTEELDRQLKTRRELNAETTRGIQSDLASLKSDQITKYTALETARRNLDVANKGGPGGFGIAQGVFDKAQQDVIDIDAAVAEAERNARSAKAVELQDRLRGGTSPKARKQRALEEKQAALTERFRGGFIGDGEYNSGFTGLQRQIDALSAGSGRSGSVSQQASTGDMVALVKQLFPRATITATTNGKHKKGSDHYAGRAIDFVPAGGMGSIGTEEAYELLKSAGVDIRRNAHGVEQFFGPGRSADKPGDHNDHFHFAWQGKASPESAKRTEDAAAKKAERDREQLLQSYADQDEGLLKAHTDQQVKGLRANQDALEFKNQLLDLEGQLAPTQRERLRIALDILENDRKIAKSKNDEALAAHQVTQAEHDTKAAEIDQLYDKRGQVVRQQNAGAFDQYRKHLQDSVGDTSQALQQVKVDGLQGLEEGLLGIISGTESVSQAFKRMAASILADLARIAIEKAILSVIGFSTGNVPGTTTGKATGDVPGFASGIISGPGTGTSDSILAWHQGMGMIRVSNGESIITAEGTRKHRRLLKAINDNTLPSFAQGMIGDVSQIRYPAAPSMASLGGPHGRPVFLFDMRGAITTDALLAQINGRMQQVGMAAMVGGSQMAQQELAERRLEAIPT